VGEAKAAEGRSNDRPTQLRVVSALLGGGECRQWLQGGRQEGGGWGGGWRRRWVEAEGAGVGGGGASGEALEQRLRLPSVRGGVEEEESCERQWGQGREGGEAMQLQEAQRQHVPALALHGLA